MTAKKHRTKKSAARPRTFEEVKAANLADPLHAARIARLNMGERLRHDGEERRSVGTRSERAPGLRGRSALAC
jgi:hypothetical protein